MTDTTIERFIPLLAGGYDPKAVKFPILGSPKLDGIRAIVRNGVVMSRNNKPIPNETVQRLYSHLEGFDGEIIGGEPNCINTYSKSVTAAMTDKGDHDCHFYIFDNIEFPDAPYRVRMHRCDIDKVLATPRCTLLPQTMLNDEVELELFEAKIVAEGYEGVMLRSPHGVYKHGRSSTREGILIKVKRFVDSEYRVIGFQEERDKFGHPKDTMGALICEDENGNKFRCGTGFSKQMRQDIWANKAKYHRAMVTVKYMAVGMVTVPRFPVFKAFRSDL